MPKLIRSFFSLYRNVLRRSSVPCCRFEPSCSHYAESILVQRGLIRGSWPALCRLLRCHPFSRGGYDPPPVMAGD